MSRDELILSCVDTVNNLVKKYNNHKPDEDLQSIGMIAVIQCVDRCLEEELNDIDQIQARCNVWARNAILSEIYKEKIKYGDDPLAIEKAPSPESMKDLIMNIEQSLTNKQLEIFDLLLQGYDKEEIMKELKIEKAMYYRHLKNMKEKIKNL